MVRVVACQLHSLKREKVEASSVVDCLAALGGKREGDRREVLDVVMEVADSLCSRQRDCCRGGGVEEVDCGRLGGRLL